MGDFNFMEQDKKSDNAIREEKILELWKENNTFKKSLEKDAPKGNYVFYDGPPFATGLPHYGHILGSTAKDVIGRYKTMQGYRVPRRWGWDCHGLPIENIVEKDLGISGKKAIEALGVDKFVGHARSKVLTYVSEWHKTVDRMGRWVDFDNSYKTMDNSFIESVWWALGEMNNKGLLYEGVRVLAYCPRCETPIANSEIAMDNSYKDITDISVYVKFRLVDKENTYLLAWTTTPWTLPGNTAIAVNNEIDYIYVKNENDTLILAKELFEKLKEKFTNPEIIKEVKGSELVGLSYEPVFPYYKNVDMPNKENIWKVWHADFVTADQGTGIAHEAPAFGEDDMNLAKEHNIPFIRHVEPNGFFTKEVTDFPDVKAKPKDDPQSTDVLVIKYLAGKGTLFAKEKIIHSYPHCYRCDTPLLYYALPSWFVNVQKVKNEMLEKAKTMNWIPEHLKEGRFKNIMDNAPDWTISRNRYWASPLPIWKSKEGKLMFVNSLDDLKAKTKKSGNKYLVMRHGGTIGNVSELISYKNQETDHLTREGCDQVRETAAQLKSENIDLIVYSTFTRTHQTAEIVRDALGLDKEKMIPDARLIEINPGNFDSKTWNDYHAHIANSIGMDWFTEKIGGGESLHDVQKRTAEVLYELEEKYKGKNILIVTHGGPAWLCFVNAGLFVPENKEYQVANTHIFVSDFKRFSNAEVRPLDFVPIPHNHEYELDLHRPYIDNIKLIDENGEEYNRIPEVIDCWFESGSMPFAQDHYPFERPDWQKENFPGGFVAEYISQTRTWFYYTHIISTILFGKAPFENVVTTGTVLAEDGQKMSKSKNNFPDPWLIFNSFGVDALRFYLMSCPVMRGEDLNFSEKGVKDITSKIITRLDNVVAFYELYRDKGLEGNANTSTSTNVLDIWITSRLNELVKESTENMEIYDMTSATRPFELFIEDLSTWYLRRSRDRLKDGDRDARQTLYTVLKSVSVLLAPFTPFLAEDIWQKLKGENDVESVHLAKWPENGSPDVEIIKEMSQAREIVTLGLQARQKENIKVRQPLSQLRITNYELGMEYQEIIKDELNIKEIKFEKGEELKVELDTNITEDLKKEGQYRELVRAVQDMRKADGLSPSDIVTLVIATNTDGEELISLFKDEFMKVVGAKEIQMGDNDGTEVKIDELLFMINILK